MNVGDLVHIAGYWPRLYQIDGYRMETHFYLGETWTECIYELHDVVTFEWAEALPEDLALIVPADQADEYIREIYETINYKSEVKEEMPKETKAEQIDRLLDELNDYKRLAAEFGDEEYVNKVEEIKRRLAEVSSD